MYQNLAILAAFAFVYSAVAGRLEKTPISGVERKFFPVDYGGELRAKFRYKYPLFLRAVTVMTLRYT